jgi:hypothetical protein
MRNVLALSAVILGLLIGNVSLADESKVVLTPDADTALVMARCSSCHSADYIQMNSTFLKRANWEAEVKKMTKAFGAPVSDEEAGKIVDYLVRHYGVE